MAQYPDFDEQQFLADLLAQLQADITLSAVVRSKQIRVLDRDPTAEDLFTLDPPTVILHPGEWEPVYYGAELLRVEPYPVNFLVITQTLDAAHDADRWMDETKGGARVRKAVARAVQRLGADADGVFPLTAPGHRLNFANCGVMNRPARLLIAAEGEEGIDVSVPTFSMLYDLEVA